jgi:hypothetical protein
MSDFYLLLTPVLVLGLLALAGFVGCDKLWGVDKFAIEHPIVVAETVITPRNDFTGWVGMVVVPQSSDRQVSSLGRFCLPGNTEAHQVKIVDATTGQDVAGSVVTINLAGQPPNQFVYADLQNSVAVTLLANLKYYVLSHETNGGDQFYDLDTTIDVSTDEEFTVPNAVFGDPTASPAIPYTEMGGPNHCYGPVDARRSEA